METIARDGLLVNGQAMALPEGASVAALLDTLKLDRRKVAVELNEEIVLRSSYEDAALHAGDRIEIVHFIGGG